MQPLDVLLNSIFKASMKKEWNEWSSFGPKILTKSGYRKKPSWQHILDSISRSLNAITEENIRKSFTLCGISEKKVDLTPSILNQRLEEILYSKTSLEISEFRDSSVSESTEIGNYDFLEHSSQG